MITDDRLKSLKRGPSLIGQALIDLIEEADAGEVTMTHREIGDAAGYGRHTVCEAMRVLLQLKIVTRTRGRGQSGFTYRLG